MISLALGIPLTVVTFLGLLLNGYILLVVILSKQIHTANNLLLLHLGIVDSLLCSLFLLFTAPSLLRGWSMPCTVHGFLFTLLHPVALWTVCGLNCDRYYAISAPLHYGALVSPRKVALGLASTWVLALILCLPPLFRIAPYSYSPALAGCAPDFASGDAALWYSTVYTTCTLLLPAALILGCNLKVLMIARYHRHRIASAIFEVTLSAQVTITHQRNPFFLPGGVASKFRGRSAISTVLQLLGSFVVLYFPYYGVIIWESSASTFLTSKDMYTRVHPHLITLASTLLTCSPPVNGLLYGIKNKLLRKSFQNYWRKQMTKNEINHEIQNRTPSACGSRRPSLTPLGILTRPSGTHLQRRLSEALIEAQKGSPKSKLQRIASEISWRPVSTSGLGLTFADDTGGSLRKTNSLRSQHAASFSTLQIPNGDQEPIKKEELIKSLRVAIASTTTGDDESKSLSVVKPVLKGSTSNTSLFVQRILGAGNIRFNLSGTHKDGSVQLTRRSPRILITRAYSEESDPTPPSPGTPNIKLVQDRKYSSSTNTLMDRKWKSHKNIEDICADLHALTQKDNNDTLSVGSNNSLDENCDDRSDFIKTNGILLQEDGNNSDADSIVWMKTSATEGITSNFVPNGNNDDSENTSNDQKGHAGYVLQSWPCSSSRKERRVIVTEMISDDESPPPTSRTRILRSSCSLTGINSEVVES